MLTVLFKRSRQLEGATLNSGTRYRALTCVLLRLSLRYNPAALIQRCWRGYRVRAGLYRARAARRMQGVTRGFLVRRRKALGLDPNTARSTRMPAVFLQNVVWRVYFTADMRYMMEDLASRALAKV